MADSSRLRGWLVVFGGILVHLTLGTLYTFGNMTPYMTSYMRERSKPSDLSYPTTTWNFALCLIGQGGSMFIGGYIEKRIGPRLTVLLGGWLMSAGVLLTYFTIKVSFYLFIVSYGLLFGFGVGIAYAPPMACAMKWMPEKKGLVNGLVVAGFGAGAFIFDQVQTKFINPDNYSPDQVVDKDKYFTTASVLDRVPTCFLLLGAIYAVMQLCGAMLLRDPPPGYGEESATVKRSLIAEECGEEESDVVHTNTHVLEDRLDVRPRQVLRSRSFYLLWWTFLVNGQAVVFISSLYKAYAQSFILDDAFLGLVGAFAAVFNASGRIAWGHLADRFSYRSSMLCLTCMMVVLMLTLVAPSYLPVNSAAAKALFFLWVCAIFGTFSGSFSLLPTATARCFGQQYVAVNYGLVFTSQMITGPLGALLASQLQSKIGWFGMFALVSSFSLSGCFLTCAFNAKRPDGREV